uniref:Uncharacterized protein n=1 Tax=Paramoeba aestuarina TaxID=180227 RepID=A0A7S4NL62_9EUKA
MDPLSIVDRSAARVGGNDRRKWVCIAPVPDANSKSDSDSDQEEALRKEKGQVSILDEELKDSGLIFTPMPFSQPEKALLRDNMTSVLRKDILPKFLRLSHEHLKAGAYLSCALRLVHQAHAYKIKRISFDRPVRHNGLLYFIDGMERNSKDSFHIWLYIRLVTIQDNNTTINTPEQIMTMNKKSKKEESRPLWHVHDWHCKKCKHRKPCDHKFQAVHQISEYTIGLHIKFPVKLDGTHYLYAMTLNSPRQGGLSSRIYLSSASAKKEKEQREAKKEKERKMSKKKEKKSEHPEYIDTEQDGSGSSSLASFSEAITDTSNTSSADMNNDLMDEESFFEKAYESASFVKGSKPSQKYGNADQEQDIPSGLSGGSSLSILEALRGQPSPKRTQSSSRIGEGGRTPVPAPLPPAQPRSPLPPPR